MSYFHGFDDKEEMLRQFCPASSCDDDYAERLKAFIDKYKDINVLFAMRRYEDYCGHAFILFERDNKLYEVHASHCSCHGIEGQFDSELTTVKELLHRLDNTDAFYYFTSEYSYNSECDLKQELRSILKELATKYE